MTNKDRSRLPDELKLRELEQLLQEMRDKRVTRRIDVYEPELPQMEFHNAGKKYFQRLFSAGNQLGKTTAGAAEFAYHLTGEYPDWWDGHVFKDPVNAWAAGISSVKVRDNQQRLLFGEPGLKEALGTGMVPKENIVNVVPARGIANYYDTVYVRHISGGTSKVKFKSYEEGPENFQSDTLDLIWPDEEPDKFQIITECLARIQKKSGIIMVTFTPLKGRTQLYEHFEKAMRTGMGMITFMTVDDVTHLTEEQKKRIREQYPIWERDARLKGIPMLGSGRVFNVAEEAIIVEPFDIPSHWAIGNGVDFGGSNHPFAAVNCAWDRDTDTFYVCSEYALSQHDAADGQLVNVATHARAINSWGLKIPTAWPFDGSRVEAGSGKTVAALFRDQKNGGINMLPTHAQWPDKSMSVELGITEMEQRMMTGGWKVFSTCRKWFEEFRYYRREEGKIVKEKDDLISASRYAYMMKKYFKTRWEIEDSVLGLRHRKQPVASGLDYDVFGG